MWSCMKDTWNIDVKTIHVILYEDSWNIHVKSIHVILYEGLPTYLVLLIYNIHVVRSLIQFTRMMQLCTTLNSVRPS